jgi:hypothetical protein
MEKKNSRSNSMNPFLRKETNRRAEMAPPATPTASRPATADPAPLSQAAPVQARTGTAQAVKESPVVLKHEQIAERAKAIWKASGCKPGRDRENWLEAERQLRKELSSR